MTPVSKIRPWLFPGSRGNWYLHPGHLMKNVRNNGIHPRQARNASLPELVLTSLPRRPLDTALH